MRTRMRLSLAALAASAVMVAATATAAANVIHWIPPKPRLLAVWRPLTFHIASNIVACNVTLGGSLSVETLGKNRNGLMGRVYEGAINSCTGGTVTLLTAIVPWHVVYKLFRGTLPHIKVVQEGLLELPFSISLPGLSECLTTSEANEPILLDLNLNESEEVESVQPDEAGTIGTRGGFLCFFAGRLSLSGNGTLLTPEGVKPTARLI